MKLIQTKKKWFFVQKIETSERIFSGENDKNHILPGCSELIIWCCISVINVLVKHHIQNQQTWLCLTQKTWRWRSNCLRCLRWILEYLIFLYLDFLILPEVNIGIFNILIFCYFNITWGEYWSDVLNFLHELLGGVADLPWTDFKEKFTRKQKANT